MLREISEEVRVNLKDRLREMRHSIRRRRHQAESTRPQARAARPSFPLNEIEDLLGHAASAFDDVMTIAEKLAPPSIARRSPSLPRPFEAYFSADDSLSGERAFRRDAYALTKAVLVLRHVERAHVSEARFAAVHAAFVKSHSALIRQLEGTGPTRVALVASLCAALLIELVRQAPLRFDEVSPENTDVDTADRTAVLSCLAPVSLACGLATLEPADASRADTIEIAALAVEARIERIAEAFADKDAQAELTALFTVLLTHLA
jgi:hypothetical protein